MKNDVHSSHDYEQIKNTAYKKYANIQPIYCPHLKQKIHFTGKGFWHIVYRSRGKRREELAQIMRFRLIVKAGQLIFLTTTIQEYDSYTGEMPVKDHGEKVMKVMKREYFGYIAIIDGWKLKVIIRKDGNGKPYFWSVIPNWITNKKRDGKFMNYTGNLEED